MKRLIAALLCVFLITVSTGCTRGEDRYAVYFASEDGKELAEEYVRIEEFGSVENKVRLITEKLLEGPSRAEHKRVIPEKTALIGVGINGKTATVNFTQDFESAENIAKRLLAIYSVVNTLCSVDGINSVRILVNGAGIRYTNGEEVGPISMNRVILADEIGRNQATILGLYFADETKSGLVSERRMVEIKDNETVEKTAVTELIKGPENKGVKLLNSNIKVLRVEVKDGICYLTLSKEFLSLPSETAELCVYSVVNTLTGLPKISFVQFFVEGEKAETLGNVTLTEPFTYNAELVN